MQFLLRFKKKTQKNNGNWILLKDAEGEKYTGICAVSAQKHLTGLKCCLAGFFYLFNFGFFYKLHNAGRCFLCRHGTHSPKSVGLVLRLRYFIII